MEFKEFPTSSIQPVRELDDNITYEEIESQLIKDISSKQPSLLKTYSKYSSLNTSSFLRDIIKNLEDYFKSQTLENDNDKIIVAKVFETIKNQLNILELYNNENKNKEVLTLIFTTTLLHIKKLLY